MNLRWAAITMLALTPAALFAAEGTFDKTISVNGAATLNVSTGSGYIHITPGPDGSIHIIGHVHSDHSWFGGSADEAVRRVTDNPPINQNGNTVDVGQHTHFQNVSIDYVITAPRGATVEAGSGSGDLDISNLGGPFKGSTGSGNIDANDLTGDVALNAGSGNITAMMNSAKYVKVETGSGNIHLRGVTGGLFAEAGSGDIEVNGQPGEGWKLETGSGNITLNTGDTAHFSLDASTGSGEVRSDPSITTHGSMDHHHMTGEVNGGGPTIRVETGSGDVRIH